MDLNLTKQNRVVIIVTQYRTSFCATGHYSRVLLEKLVKKFPVLYGTRRFITAFISARQLSLSWASSIQSIPPHPTSWRSILILSSHLRLGLPSGSLSLGLPQQNPLYVYPLHHTRYMPRQYHSLRFYHPDIITGSVQIIKFLIR
jgi:hypothetical protein